MRRTVVGVLVVAAVTVSGACGDNYQFTKECNETYAALCKHQIDCQAYGVSDQAQCEADLREGQICDDSHPPADFQTCQDAVLATACSDHQPCECWLVMCDASIGCSDAAPQGNCSTSGGSGYTTKYLR